MKNFIKRIIHKIYAGIVEIAMLPFRIILNLMQQVVRLVLTQPPLKNAVRNLLMHFPWLEKRLKTFMRTSGSIMITQLFIRKIYIRIVAMAVFLSGVILNLMQYATRLVLTQPQLKRAARNVLRHFPWLEKRLKTFVRTNRRITIKRPQTRKIQYEKHDLQPNLERAVKAWRLGRRIHE